MLNAMVVASALSALLGATTPAIPSLDPATASVLKYWAMDRFVLDRGSGPVFEFPRYDRERLAKAQPDECFNGIGAPITPISPDGTCTSGIPKVNQSYVWGLVKVEDHLWFGTVSNTRCLAEGATPGGGADITPPYSEGFYVCEYQRSQSGTGDWRRPQLYRYDLRTHKLDEMSPPLGTPAGDLLASTTGIRSAGAINDIVLFSGPAFIPGTGPISSEGTIGINVFAFRASTGELLGAKKLLPYNNIRSFVEYGGALYTTVANSLVDPVTPPGGSVLRYRGRIDPNNPDALFEFEVVGKLDTGGASIALHQGRFFITTWPTLLPAAITSSVQSSLYMGPKIPTGGLTAAHLNQWTKIWEVSDYEPDLAVRFATLGGAMASYKGDLYWGTMQATGTGIVFAMALDAAGIIDLDANGNQQLDMGEALNAFFGTSRSTVLFRLRGDIASMTPTQRKARIEQMYGERIFPVYDPAAKAYTVALDSLHANRMPNPIPRWGASGFGSFFNAYTWSMRVFDDQLFIGTMDSSVGFRAMLSAMMSGATAFGVPGLGENIASVIEEVGLPWEGADLLRMPCSDGRVVAESLRGLGIYTSFGVRNMVTGDGTLYVGMANEMSLNKTGGWELLQLTPKR